VIEIENLQVTSASKIDTVYDNKMAKLCSERDKRQDLIESKRMYAEGSENNNDLQKFLAGGIDIKSVCVASQLSFISFLLIALFDSCRPKSLLERLVNW
jgi:hypothetical protein